MPDNDFIEEAIRRAEALGLRPSMYQNSVDWDEVELWSCRVRQPGFVWLFDGDNIIISRDGSVCHGQHRLLGGLMGGNPPPLDRQDFYDDARKPWRDADLDS